MGAVLVDAPTPGTPLTMWPTDGVLISSASSSREVVMQLYYDHSNAEAGTSKPVVTLPVEGV